MTTLTPHVVPVFATPFGVVPLPATAARNAELGALLRSRSTPDRRAPGAGTGTRTFRSREDLFDWPEPLVQGARAEILAGIAAVVASINEVPVEELATLRVEARGWFTVIGPDGHVPAVGFANSAWLGLYCVEAPPPSPTRLDSGVLRMLETRLGTMFADATNAQLRVPYRTGHYSWRPVPGELAVLPGPTVHEIALLRADSPLVLIGARVRYVGADQTGMAWW